jgi:D-glycerate 3-kinase
MPIEDTTAEPPRWPARHTPSLAETAARVLERARPQLDVLLAREQLGDDVRALLEPLYLPLAGWLAEHRKAKNAPLVAGIAGAQGAGKSSLAAVLAILLEAGLGLRTVALSLDDLYCTRAERLRLAREVHPLLATRGLPGTHDVALGVRVLAELCAARSGAAVRYPRFDKALDDRVPEHSWPEWQGPTDVVLFEGWCLGATPEPEAALTLPLNAFEREQDSDARFRHHANAQLAGPYRTLFDMIDVLVFLAVPDMPSVLRWRGEQEQRLRGSAAPNAPGLMSAAQLERFVQSFERISRHMLMEMPARADLVLRLDRDHGCHAVEVRG